MLSQKEQIRDQRSSSGIIVSIIEVNRQLSDSQVYEEVDKDRVIDACNSIEGRLQELSVCNPSLERIVEYPNAGDSKVGRFYFLPKIHKD